MSPRGREVVLVSLAVVVAGVCVRLGVWQVHRLTERRARNAEVRAQRERPPVVLPAHGVAPESLVQRRIVARGVYDSAFGRAWRPRLYDGVPGAAMVTPLRLADGSGVLVDRGWVSAATAAAGDPRRYPPPDSAVTVHGLAWAAPRGRGDVDPRALADTVPYALLPVIVMPDSAARAATPLIHLPAPALDDGPHLSYAVQWFSFALIALIGTAALLRRERSRGTSDQRRRSIGT